MLDHIAERHQLLSELCAAEGMPLTIITMVNFIRLCLDDDTCIDLCHAILDEMAEMLEENVGHPVADELVMIIALCDENRKNLRQK